MAGSRADVLVLGAGILGSALTYHLARSGRTRVVLCDAADPPGAATARSAGIVSVQGWDEWDLELVRETALEYEAIAERVGAGRFRRNGGLRVARTPEGERWLEQVRRYLSRAGLDARTVGPDEVGTYYPRGNFADVRSGLLTPGDGVADAPELAEAYRTMARQLGAELNLGTGPWAPNESDVGWRVDAPNATWEAPSLVLACGGWTKQLLSRLGRPLPLAPFRSCACTLRPEPLAPAFPTLHDLDFDLYLRPGGQGRVLAGDGTEHQEADPDASGSADRFGDRTRGVLRDLFPEWRGLAIESSWSGVCVASPDRYPLVGRVPGKPGLFVSSGFNGFGVMRAGALARRLAEGIVADRWAPLAPADPARFPDPFEPFDPHPEFPLESTEELLLSAGAPPRAGLAASVALPQGHEVEYTTVSSTLQAEQLDLPSLSEWFDPFLRRFLTEALRTGGTAEVARSAGRVVGAYLFSPSEGIGSVFTQRRAVAEHYLDRTGAGGVYAEGPWRPGGEPVRILAADLRDWELRLPLRNPVRLSTTEDLPRVSELMRQLTGTVDESWLDSLPRADELGFLCEIGDRLAGMSWATVVGEHARGHSFMVHPRFRGLGVGTDLLQARMIWLRQRGVRQVISEIYEGNSASETAAVRAGMAYVADMYHYHPNGPAGPARRAGA